jgi:serine/threonine-protein kinase
MTPEYAAPEQVRGEPVTTLTDVYQLGVVLYELLTGTLPFGRRERSAYELAHAILGREAPPPSAMRANSRALRGDVDAIVLKALRKEPEQRYPSAQAFQDDIARHLTGLPVRARQGNTLYGAFRFVRRHRWSVAAAVMVLLLLTGYAVTLTMNARRMRAALARAEQERAKAEGAAQFLVGLFSPKVPGLGPRDTLTAPLLIARGERQMEELRDQPLAQAQLLSVLGTIHLNRRAFDRAQTLLERALALRRASLGEDHPDVAESLYQLGVVLRARGEYERARELFQRALAIQRRTLDEAHPAVVLTVLRLSQLFTPIDEQIATAREALALARRAQGAEHAVVADRMVRLGLLLLGKGIHDEAEALFRESLAMRWRLPGADDRSMAPHGAALAILLKHQGRFAEAERLHRSDLEVRESLHGPDHPEVVGALHMLAELLTEKGEYDEAERLARRALAIQERAVGEDHLGIAESLFHLADVLQAKGDLREAEALRRRELAIMRGAYGVAHVNVSGSLYGLALVLLDLGETAEAEALLLESKAIRERSYGTGSSATALILTGLARLARERRDYPVADSLLQRALHNLRAAGYTNLQEEVQHTHRELVVLSETWGKPETAAQHRRLLIIRQE